MVHIRNSAGLGSNQNVIVEITNCQNGCCRVLGEPPNVSEICQIYTAIAFPESDTTIQKTIINKWMVFFNPQADNEIWTMYTGNGGGVRVKYLHFCNFSTILDINTNFCTWCVGYRLQRWSRYIHNLVPQEYTSKTRSSINTYNLRQRQLTVKSDEKNFVPRKLYQDTYWQLRVTTVHRFIIIAAGTVVLFITVFYCIILKPVRM